MASNNATEYQRAYYRKNKAKRARAEAARRRLAIQQDKASIKALVAAKRAKREQRHQAELALRAQRASELRRIMVVPL